MPYKRAILWALGVFLALRILTSLVVLVSALSIPPNPPPAPFEPSVVADLESRGRISQLFLAPWYRWDAVHYLQIADYGYAYNMENTVWPPLYPALINVFKIVFQPSLLAALVVSNLAAIGAFFLLYLLVADVWDESRARHVLVWTAIFPTGFYLLAAYTESLFLLLAVGSLLAARKREWWLAGICGALAAMTRLTGLLLAVPILWEAYEAVRQERGRQLALKSAAILLPLALMPLSVALFSWAVHFRLGADWPWNTLTANWHLVWAPPWTGVAGTLTAMSHAAPDFNQASRFVDVFLTLWFAFLFFYGVKRIPVQYSLYSLVLFLPSITKILDNNTLMSVSRYLLPLFPLLVAQDMVAKPLKARVVVAALSLAGQVMLIYMFYRWFWVA